MHRASVHSTAAAVAAPAAVTVPEPAVLVFAASVAAFVALLAVRWAQGAWTRESLPRAAVEASWRAYLAA